MFAKYAKVTNAMKPAFSLEDFESGKIVVDPRWLNKVEGKCPGDESIEELLAALNGGWPTTRTKFNEGEDW